LAQAFANLSLRYCISNTSFSADLYTGGWAFPWLRRVLFLGHCRGERCEISSRQTPGTWLAKSGVGFIFICDPRSETFDMVWRNYLPLSWHGFDVFKLFFHRWNYSIDNGFHNRVPFCCVLILKRVAGNRCASKDITYSAGTVTSPSQAGWFTVSYLISSAAGPDFLSPPVTPDFRHFSSSLSCVKWCWNKHRKAMPSFLLR